MNSKMPTDRGHVHTEHHHPDNLALDACTPAQLIKQLAHDHENVPRIIAQAAG
jgi:N-acetylmuramic acid 6-phosphate (MurNAc-6-P) etherase